MINSFYEALKNAQTWFFGDLLSDSFFASCVQIFNAMVIFSMFYGIIFVPLRWCLSKLIKRIKGVIDDE